MSYRLVACLGAVTRTDEWNPRTVIETLWRIEGPGIDRPATDVEIAIVQNAMQRAVELVKPFSEFVNVTKIGSTPEEALRKEFGL